MGRCLITVGVLLVSLSLTLNAECSQDEQTSQGCGCSATSRDKSSAVVTDDAGQSGKTPTESATPPSASDRHEKRTNGMVQIDGDTFLMGSNKPIIQADGEGPARHVTVDTFWMDVHEVSNAEFKKFVDATGYVTEVSNCQCHTFTIL